MKNFRLGELYFVYANKLLSVMILSYWRLNWFLFDWESRALCVVIESLSGLRLGAQLCYAL